MYLMFDQCNSRCRTCNIWQQKHCDKPITPKQLRDLLHSELFRNIEYFGITGGEPTLFDLDGFLQVAHEVLPQAALSISSNGLNPVKLYDAVEKCVSAGIHLDVGLSLDGIGEFHDYWRGVKGNFEKVDWLVHKLKILQCEYPILLSFGVGSTLTVETAQQADSLRAYCKNVGIPFVWHWFNYAPFYHNAPRKADVALFESAILKVVDKSIHRDMWLSYLRTGKFPRLKCQAFSSYLLLNCDGTIRPCLSLWNHSGGNMLENDPIAVWTSKEADDVRQRVSQCHGCLNMWACNWNLVTNYPKYLIKKVALGLRSS
jgi:MoaA/NifB/PqqE/SkfB family radical SAM enzyme